MVDIVKYWVAVGLLAFSPFVMGQRYDLIDEFDIPAAAFDTKRLRLGVNPRTEQIFFRIREPYPSTNMIDLYSTYLHNQGWTECWGNTKGWSHHMDESGSRVHSVHRLVRYWIDNEKSKLTILSSTYYSGKVSRDRPDTDVQNIVLWIQEAPFIEDELSRLSINCPED